MSGSAALSAAKNRRTASAPPSPSSYNSTQKNDNVTSKQVEGPKNPLQIRNDSVDNFLDLAVAVMNCRECGELGCV